MHTLQSIVSELTSMEHALTERGYLNADADLNLHWSHGSPLRLSLDYWANGESSHWNETRRTETDEALSELIAAAWEHIRELRSPEELEREAFLLEFGRTLDKARDLGLPVEFLNPLEESMRKLSENILPAPKAGS